MHILIAPNAFKNSLTAAEAAKAIQQGLQRSKLQCTSDCFPIADGGDGTGALIIEKREGEIAIADVLDPLGRMIRSQFGLIDNGKTAVIEMADSSGLRLLKADELNPMNASSFGTGQSIQLALDKGVDKIIIAMGGSATVDGGCGILNALGVNFLDSPGHTLLPDPQNLLNMAGIDVSRIDARIFGCDVVILCDVNNKLLGPEGSAAIFGPQKGASPEDVIKLENFLTRFNDLTRSYFGKNMVEYKYGGAAGGAAAGLKAFLNARLVNGIEYFLQLTHFDQALQNSDLLITGEGSIDLQTLQGKGPFGVAQQARIKNIPVIGLAGMVPLEQSDELARYFNVLMAIGNGPSDMKDALKNARLNLVRTATTIGDLLSLQ